ncbi:hypothetical protein NM688_g8180 [Phlebia brevispora]|uniref:Uncharacterized protein n=1 Tax=Phlebia brevispora TaxID=194682 RepID=A0ACC1RWA8_9APHY|nr:hypothetical protein NM688_g8180 [Phlebia brevispora]
MSSEVAQCLAATLSPDSNARIAAELRLSKLSEIPVLDESCYHAAGILLRKFVEERWSPMFKNFRGPAPSVEIKAEIRKAVFQGLSDRIRKVRTYSSHILSKIASCDWPEEYPDLLSSLMTLLTSGSPDAIHGALQMFSEFGGDEISEDHLLPIQKQLLPVLLGIVNTPDRHSPLTRARAISVFRQCMSSLYMVREVHKQPVKEVTAAVLPIWMDTFKALLGVDPLSDVKVQYWDGIALKREIIKTLDTIRVSFPQFLIPYLPDFLTAVLNHLNVLFPTYYHYNVVAEDSAPGTSEEDPIELSQLSGVCLDFIAGVARQARSRKWFTQAHLFALVSAIVPWAEITNDDAQEWANDVNAFVGQDLEEDPTSYSIRRACFDLLSALVDDHMVPTAAALQEVVKAVVIESSQVKDAGQDGWWRKLEAALASAGSVSEDLNDANSDEVASGRPPVFNVNNLFSNVMPNLLSLIDIPFLQGRAFVFASQFVEVLPAELAGQYIEAAVQVLEANAVTIPVKASAIEATKGFITKCPETTIAPHAQRICKCIVGFMQICTADTLSMVLETLSRLLSIQQGRWLTPELAQALLPTTLDVWQKSAAGEIHRPHVPRAQRADRDYVPDYAIQSTISVILTRLVEIPMPGVYEAVVGAALPHLCHAIASAQGEDIGIAGAALEQVSALLEGAPTGHLGEGFVNTLAPCLFGQMEDRNAIQWAITSLALIVRKDFQQLLQWKDPATGQSGLDCTLTLVAKQLQTDDEPGSLYIGNLIINLMTHAGDALLPVLPQLLQAMTTRMLTAKTSTFMQSLIAPFVFLIHNGHRDTVLSLLESMDINGRTGLDVFVNTWCENAEVLQGFWTPRMSTLAFIDMFQCDRPSLRNLLVKGDLIIKPETRNVIMTRSRTKAIPNEFTMIPFHLKALKILVNELRSGGEPSGLRSSDLLESKSEDGDDWTDEESLAASESVRGTGGAEDEGDIVEMLYGKGIPPELLSDAAMDKPSVDQIDDEERMKDPLVLVDIRAQLISVLKDAAARNANNFSDMAGQLKAEEMLLIEKAVHSN